MTIEVRHHRIEPKLIRNGVAEQWPEDGSEREGEETGVNEECARKPMYEALDLTVHTFLSADAWETLALSRLWFRQLVRNFALRTLKQTGQP
jgi:hypothetical protein